MRFASFLSGGFATMTVIYPPERKLAKRTSVEWKIVDILHGTYHVPSMDFLLTLHPKPSIKSKNSSLSQLVARFQIFRSCMKGQFDAYLL